MLKIGILDQSPVYAGESAADALRHTLELAGLADRLGYSRYWVSEHHNGQGLAGSSPEILISAIGAHTRRIRIGSGGVLLPHYSPYKVAENFRLLEGLYPGRIDLGIGRAPGGMPLVSLAMGREKGKDREGGFTESLRELGAYLGTGSSLEPQHPLHGLTATPVVDTKPEAWLLGSSSYGGAVAAAMGARYAFAHFLNGHGGQSMIQSYRESYQTGPLGAKSAGAVCVFVVCMDTDEEAEREARALDLRLLRLEQGQYDLPMPTREEAEKYSYSDMELARIADNRSRMLVGGPGRLARLLPALARSYGTDEVIVNVMLSDPKERMRSCERLAKLFLPPIHRYSIGETSHGN